MDQRTKNLLGIQEYRVLGTRRLGEGDEEMEVALPNTSRCPHCGAPTTRVHQEARRPSRVLWGFINGRRLWLVVHPSREGLRCRACRRVFTQPLPGVASFSGRISG